MDMDEIFERLYLIEEYELVKKIIMYLFYF